jgi:hypothetical protein
MSYFLPSGWMQVIQPITHDDGGKRCSVTYGVQLSSVATASDAITEADSLFRGNFGTFFDTQANLESAQGYAHTAGGDLLEFTSEEAPTSGAASQGQPPPNVAWVLRKRTQFVGRHQRGRMYFPWSLGETSINEIGQLTTTAVSNRTAAGMQWLDDVEAAVFLNGVVLLHSGPPLGPGLAPSPLVSVDCAPIVRTQRRRLLL